MVRLTKQTDYALVLLTFMARTHAQERWTATELAAETTLPPPMVSKILKALGRAGILVSHRGVKGGYSLCAPAAEISIARIVEVFEGPLALTECTHPGGAACDYAGHCPTAGNWGLISRAIAEALDSLTLEDMCRPMRRLPRQSAETPALATT